MDPLETLNSLVDQLPNLDDLSDDPRVRRSQLEEKIEELDPLMRIKRDLVNTMKAAIRKKEQDLFSTFDIEFDYMDGTSLKPKHPEYELLIVPTGRVVLYTNKKKVLEQIEMAIHRELATDIPRFGIYLKDAVKWGKCLNAFQVDLAVRYADVRVIGEENLTHHHALVFTVNATPGIAMTNINFKRGTFISAGVYEKMTREYFLNPIHLARVERAHHGHNHNTYVIIHSSPQFDQYQLGMFSGKIVEDRHRRMNPQLLN